MISIRLLFSGILFVSFTVFILFFGRLPAFRNNPIGKLNRVLSIHLPNGFLAVDRRVTGGRTCLTLAKGCRFLMNDRHPTVLILFILLMLIPEIMFVPPIWPTTTTSSRTLIALIILIPYIFLYLAAFTDPGSVNAANVREAQSLYPADQILYSEPPKRCRTCNLTKPARSKHCSICKVCVARADHHCIFINRCVGYNNTHYFILLLLSTSILISAGVFLGIDFLQTQIPLAHPGFTLWGRGLAWSDYWTFTSYVLVTWTRVSSITLLCTFMCPLVWALTGYQIYLLWAGMTTNETSKWGDLACDIRNGIVFKRTLSSQESESREGRWPKRAGEIVVTTIDGHPPKGARAEALSGHGDWIKVVSLNELDNVYDLGFRRNARDVFMTRKLRLA